MQLLVDPRQQSDWAVRKSVSERLRFGSLQQAVVAALFGEPVGAGEAGFFGGGVGGQGVLEREEGEFGWGGSGGADHVDVGDEAGGGVEAGDGAGDPEAPVATLGY